MAVSLVELGDEFLLLSRFRHGLHLRIQLGQGLFRRGSLLGQFSGLFSENEDEILISCYVTKKLRNT